jgi:putative transposase
MAVSEATFFRWKQKFSGLGPSELRKLRQLEEENAKLKKLVADLNTREALAIVVDSGIRGEHVVEAVEAVATDRGAPCLIRVVNGPEFVSKVLDRWAYERRVTLDFSRPGKPTDNAVVESFNGRLRDERLDTHWFLSLEDARAKIEAWRRDYNASRPHSALGHRTHQEFAAKAARKGCS